MHQSTAYSAIGIWNNVDSKDLLKSFVVQNMYEPPRTRTGVGGVCGNTLVPKSGMYPRILKTTGKVVFSEGTLRAAFLADAVRERIHRCTEELEMFAEITFLLYLIGTHVRTARDDLHCFHSSMSRLSQLSDALAPGNTTAQYFSLYTARSTSSRIPHNAPRLDTDA